MKTKFELGERVWVVDVPVKIENCNTCGQTLHVEEPENVYKAVVVAMCLNGDGSTAYSIEVYKENKETDNYWYCGEEPFKYIADIDLFKTERSARAYVKAVKKQHSYSPKYKKKK